VVTNYVPQVVTAELVTSVTNAVTGEVSRQVTIEPVATNVVEVLRTKEVVELATNQVTQPTTNLTASPAALATIEATGSVVNAFLPGFGSMVALVLGGLYHGYRQLRNRRVNEALVQGVETARAVLETTPQGQAADTAFVKWLMSHQKEAGVFTTVATLVDNLSDNPAAKLAAQEIVGRVQKAQGAVAM